MERKFLKEYLVVFLVEGEKFKLRNLPSRTSSLLSVLLRTRSAKRLISQHMAAVLSPNLAELVPSVFFLSTTMVFAAVQTHFPRKNACVYRNTLTYVTRLTSNRFQVHRLNSQHLAMVRQPRSQYFFPFFPGNEVDGLEVKHSRASALRYFLSTTMVFAAVPTHFPKNIHPRIGQSSCDQ